MFFNLIFTVCTRFPPAIEAAARISRLQSHLVIKAQKLGLFFLILHGTALIIDLKENKGSVYSSPAKRDFSALLFFLIQLL